MKKFLGFKIGGLKHKILSIVLIIFVLIIASIIVVSYYRTKYLSNTVSAAREEQQIALSNVSTNAMHQVIEESMTRTNEMQAYIADDMFEDIRSDVMTLQSLAEGMFSSHNSFEPIAFNPPNPDLDGEITAQALWDETVEDYRTSQYLPIAARMSNTMIAMCRSSAYMDNCYFGFEDGTSLCVDSYSANKYDEDGNIIAFPARERSWYTDAVDAGEVRFSGVIYDTFSGRSCVTCSAPVIVDNQLIGVVGIDLFLDEMEDYVQTTTTSGGFNMIINEDGQVIFAPEDNGLFTIRDEESADDLRESSNQQLADFVTRALTESTGLQIVAINDVDYYMVGSPVDAVGWTVVSVIEKNVTEASTNQMLAEYDTINDAARSSYRGGVKMLSIVTYLLIGIVMTFGIVALILLADKFVKPIESMTADIVEGANTGKLFEMKDMYKTNDEIQVLAESFDELSKKTKKYIEDITEITKEKERIGTELSLAKSIQASMLPHVFPPFPHRTEFDIYAMMDPAREVGGDFYDYYLIDDDHLGLVVADVSGKGIPAALFMMISKTILQSCAMLGKSPSEILEKTNDALCSNNLVEMFVTVWVGIVEISTGKLTASNAGHEYPVIKRADGQYEIYKDKHSLAVGAMEDTVYSEYEIMLGKGDRLFLYTDGVPEATDSDENMFGSRRMLDALNSTPDADPEGMLNSVKNAVNDFVQNAEQFDDLTMLGFEYRGPST